MSGHKELMRTQLGLIDWHVSAIANEATHLEGLSSASEKLLASAEAIGESLTTIEGLVSDQGHAEISTETLDRWIAMAESLAVEVERLKFHSSAASELLAGLKAVKERSQ